MPPPDVVSATEIAAMLGVSRQRVTQLAARPEFPEGIRLRGSWVWARGEVVAWAVADGRTISGGK